MADDVTSCHCGLSQRNISCTLYRWQHRTCVSVSRLCNDFPLRSAACSPRARLSTECERRDPRGQQLLDPTNDSVTDCFLSLLPVDWRVVQASYLVCMQLLPTAEYQNFLGVLGVLKFSGRKTFVESTFDQDQCWLWLRRDWIAIITRQCLLLCLLKLDSKFRCGSRCKSGKCRLLIFWAIQSSFYALSFCFSGFVWFIRLEHRVKDNYCILHSHYKNITLNIP